MVRVRALASGAFACVGDEAAAGTEACNDDDTGAELGETISEDAVELKDEGKNDFGEPFPPCDADEGEADEPGRTMGLVMGTASMKQKSAIPSRTFG